LKNVPLTDLRVEKIPFKIHPRVFAALGSDLVTNDVVAIIELVKNSYDAVASRVDVRFVDPDAGDRFLEVLDDGVGMSRHIIEDAWCVVATPFRQNNPVSSKAEHERRASGNKGLGRLSAARLRPHQHRRSDNRVAACRAQTSPVFPASSRTRD
jgi:hypothetical protein